MMKALVFSVAFYITLTLSGCSTTPPLKHDFQSMDVFEAPFDIVWQAMKGFFEDRDIPLMTVEKDSGTIVTEELKIPYEGFNYYSKYCDCGTLGGLYVYREMIGKIYVSVVKQDDEHTFVKVSTNYRASKWLRDNFKGWVVCESRGYAEGTVLGFIKAEVEKFKKKKEKPESGERPFPGGLLPLR
jgi:uncharacterized protein YceK